jgi:hypothetical protein
MAGYVSDAYSYPIHMGYEIHWIQDVSAPTSLEVAKDVLHNSEMRLMRIVHVETHLLDFVGDLRPGEGEVLESPTKLR